MIRFSRNFLELRVSSRGAQELLLLHSLRAFVLFKLKLFATNSVVISSEEAGCFRFKICLFFTRALQRDFTFLASSENNFLTHDCV